jgi:hypothetical protein
MKMTNCIKINQKWFNFFEKHLETKKNTDDFNELFKKEDLVINRFIKTNNYYIKDYFGLIIRKSEQGLKNKFAAWKFINVNKVKLPINSNVSDLVINLLQRSPNEINKEQVFNETVNRLKVCFPKEFLPKGKYYMVYFESKPELFKGLLQK